MENLYIIKIGGNIIDDDAKLAAFLKDFATIPGKKILVHGGGKLATRLAADLGIEQQLVDGRRITDAATLRIVTMVYAGYINKNIVAQLQAAGCPALGLSGADGNAILAHKRVHPTMDYGFVGDIDQVNTDFLAACLESGATSPGQAAGTQGQTLVMAPISHDGRGQLLNTNADTIAQELATALSSRFTVHLIYSFEKSGVLLNAEDDGSVIGRIDPDYYTALKEQQVIFAGMIPKLDNAFTALRKGVSRVIIGRAEQLQQLLRGEAGTTIALQPS